ncbi:class C beta-lactamase-related serine hydrolase [Paenibacillaceae bacterium]|nr:class C beta-lactamase-related serine hydrolase [Paenibacillaceae bacterium]
MPVNKLALVLICKLSVFPKEEFSMFEQFQQRISDLPNGQPEDYAMDRQYLDNIEGIAEKWKLEDVVIVRSGAVVWKWHKQGSDRATPIFSCTKSILSALTGIAISEGLFTLDDPVEDHLEEWAERARQTEPRKSDITVRHLLTMTAGLDWPEFDKPYFKMKKGKDWLHYIAKQPLTHEPSHTFAYNSGCSHLLSAIITKRTGKSALEYGRSRLFDQLGIQTVEWNEQEGVSEGGTGMQMTASDMAKFGLLYLQGGKWGSEQLIHPEWIEQSTSAHNKGLLHYQPPLYGNYAFHWWVSDAETNGWCDYYFALGYGGQYLFIVPEHNLVAVIRKQVEGRNNALLSRRLLHEYVAPALL